MTYTLHPEAESDIAAALDFYSEQAGRAVAERFLDDLSVSPNSWLNIPTSEHPLPEGERHFP